jgi:predicted metalloprotease with PDZ domain
MTGKGIDEDGFERVAEEVTGLKLTSSIDAWVRSTAPLPLRTLLASHGITLELREQESSEDKGGKRGGEGAKLPRAALGVRARAEGKDLLLSHVLEGGAAQEAGLSAGDAIVAVDGLRPAGGLDGLLANRRAGERLRVHAFRRDELLEFDVQLKRATRDTCVLVEAQRNSAMADKWLGKK